MHFRETVLRELRAMLEAQEIWVRRPTGGQQRVQKNKQVWVGPSAEAGVLNKSNTYFKRLTQVQKNTSANRPPVCQQFPVYCCCTACAIGTITFTACGWAPCFKTCTGVCCEINTVCPHTNTDGLVERVLWRFSAPASIISSQCWTC